VTESLLRFVRLLRRHVLPASVSDGCRSIYWHALSTATGARGVRMRFSDGFSYRIEPRLFSWQIDKYEPAVVRELTRAVTPDAVVYDVGAHVGLITLVVARRLDATRGRIYAFEPAPPNFALLRRHVHANGFDDRVALKQVLVGDTCDPSVGFVHRDEPFTANSLAYEVERGTTTTVAMVTIDRLVADGDARPPTVVKIDVEGFEGAVLRGAKNTLETHRPVVICAMHPEPLARLGETTAGIVGSMREAGYTAAALDGTSTTEPGFEEVVFRAR
jgi:FkbM family methyltransferase